jgi:hypothetical protein
LPAELFKPKPYSRVLFVNIFVKEFYLTRYAFKLKRNGAKTLAFMDY